MLTDVLGCSPRFIAKQGTIAWEVGVVRCPCGSARLEVEVGRWGGTMGWSKSLTDLDDAPPWWKNVGFRIPFMTMTMEARELGSAVAAAQGPEVD